MPNNTILYKKEYKLTKQSEKIHCIDHKRYQKWSNCFPFWFVDNLSIRPFDIIEYLFSFFLEFAHRPVPKALNIFLVWLYRERRVYLYV